VPVVPVVPAAAVAPDFIKVATSPRVLIIAPHGSYRTMPFIQAAHQLGVPVLIASEGKHSIVSDYARGLHLNPRDVESSLPLILQEAELHGEFTAVIGTDDSTVELAAAVASAFGLPHNEPEALQLSRRKDLARDRLQQHHIPKPTHRLLDLREDITSQAAGFDYPAVIKPLALSASRGVIRVNDPEQLQQACERVGRMLACEPDLEESLRHRLLLESFIPGREVAVEGMLYNGELQILTLFDKPDPLDGPYFEETYYITPGRLSEAQQQQLYRVIADTCTAYGLREGPIHAECRINAQGAWVLEVAARTIGGMCGQLLQFGTGLSLEQLVLQHAMGKPIAIEPMRGGAGVLMIPIPGAGLLKRVEGLLQAQRVPYIEEISIQIREGYEVRPLPEGASYLGFIFARAPSPDLAEQALREAHACLNIVIDPLIQVRVA